MSAVGYRVVLPGGWRTLHLRDDLEGQVKQLVADSATRVPASVSPDQLAPKLRQAEQKLITQLSRARENGVIDYYLPTSRMDQPAVLANLMVSMQSPEDIGDIDADMVGAAMAVMLTEPGTSAVTIDDTVWVRRLSTVREKAPEFDEEVTSLRVEYRTAMPGHPRHWVLAVGSVVGDGDPDSDATQVSLELVDAIMANWRWKRDDFAAGDER